MALRASYYGLKKRILDKVLGDYDASGVLTNKELTDKAFKYVDYLASKDLNTITETGFYKLGGSITNGPGVNYGFLEVFKTDGNNITQIVYGLSTGEFIYSRRNYNGTWGSWYKFTGTAVS